MPAPNTTPADTSKFTILQQRISVITWIAVLLLSLRGLFVFYDNQVKGSFELVLNFVTEPAVQLFNLGFLSSLNDIPAISILFATVSILLASSILQVFIKYTEFRLVRARSYVLQRAISVK